MFHRAGVGGDLRDRPAVRQSTRLAQWTRQYTPRTCSVATPAKRTPTTSVPRRCRSCDIISAPKHAPLPLPLPSGNACGPRCVPFRKCPRSAPARFLCGPRPLLFYFPKRGGVPYPSALRPDTAAAPPLPLRQRTPKRKLSPSPWPLRSPSPLRSPRWHGQFPILVAPRPRRRAAPRHFSAAARISV